jgi:hypothetical protein
MTGETGYGNGTVKQRIIAHLYKISGEIIDSPPYHQLPKYACQDGIAEAVGISRAHAALELTTLEEDGIIETRLGHVEGSHRRRKVYYLKYNGGKNG